MAKSSPGVSLSGNEALGKRWVTRKRKGDEDIGPRAGGASRWDASWNDRVAPQSLATRGQEHGGCRAPEGAARRQVAARWPEGHPQRCPLAGGSPAAPPPRFPRPQDSLRRPGFSLPSSPPPGASYRRLQMAEFNFRVLAETGRTACSAECQRCQYTRSAGDTVPWCDILKNRG